MAVNLADPGELLVVPGVTLGAASARVKETAGPSSDASERASENPRDDVAVMVFEPGTTVAGVFTQSGFAAPPVALCRESLDAGVEIRALIMNSGNANAATGDRGLEDARTLCEQVAESLQADTSSVLPFSTGVIGEFLPVQRMTKGLSHCVTSLAADHWPEVARAIMTTDTIPKATSRAQLIGGTSVVVTGTAKGSGMMRPDMATMLAFMACDAAVTRPCLDNLVREVADASFNRLTVDGDTSTNDSFVLACTGQSDLPVIESPADPAYAELRRMLVDAASELAQAIVRDGEGATKFITLEVSGGRAERECREVAFTVAQSPLVKTAIFAGDPNWGRFCMAIGRAGLEDFDQSTVALHLDSVCIARDGLVASDYVEENAAEVMARDEYRVHIDLGRGQAGFELWTTDLSYEYVRINAEYRT